MAAVPASQTNSAERPWRVFRVAAAGAAGLWLAFPPCGWWPLVLVAVACWTWLTNPALSLGRHSWWAIWFASLAYWLGMNYFVVLPHWAGTLGWLAMSSYLASYLPLFVWTSRLLRRHWGWSAALACPFAWVAMEWVRAHLISGYGMAMLPHAMYRQPLWIQSADLIGGYGVSAWLVACGAGLEQAVVARRWRSLLWVGFLLAAVSGYGAWRLQEERCSDPRRCTVALIQGSRDVVFGLAPRQEADEAVRKFREYRDLTREALRQWPDCQLVVWPEGMFPAVDYLPSDEISPGNSAGGLDLAVARENFRMTWQAALGGLPLLDDPSGPPTPLPDVFFLTGGSSVQLPQEFVYNATLLLSPAGDVVSRYFKIHLVMFGEYVPFGEWFPWVYRLTPLPGGLTPGRQTVVFTVAGVRFAPSVCFESTVGRVIRRQVVEPPPDQQPDCLVNLTNDGWFYGSSCLDQHLACNVFRAVELRKPVLVAANTGFSAHIDGCGRILAQGPRRQTATLRALVGPDGRRSGYARWGELPALLATLTTALLGIAGSIRAHRRENQTPGTRAVEGGGP